MVICPFSYEVLGHIKPKDPTLSFLCEETGNTIAYRMLFCRLLITMYVACSISAQYC